MAHHVNGHIHFLIQFALAQFARQLLRQLVCLEDVLAVHQKDNLVAALRVVGVHIVLLQQIVLQSFDRLEEAGAVAIVEGMRHVASQGLEFLGLLIVFCSQDFQSARQQEKSY